MNRYSFLLLLVALIDVTAILSAPARAHQPYSKEVSILQSPSGDPLIVEKLFGDGIVVSDPVSLQIRNENNAVIANSPVGDYLTAFCPALRFCLAFRYGNINLFAEAWKLDYANLNYNAGDDHKIADEDYFHDDPDRRKGSQGFNQASFIWTLVSPVFIIIDYWILLIVSIVIFIVPAFAKFIHRHRSGKEKGLAGLVFRMLVYIVCLVYAAGAVAFFTMFMIFEPLVYVSLCVMAGTCAGLSLSRKLSSRLAKPLVGPEGLEPPTKPL